MKNLESGRTMVEMIAVLMVMIILSLVGMIGYNGVKNYWKATEIISAAQDVMAYARTKGKYVKGSNANFSFPKGIIDMEAYVGGDAFNLSTTTHNYINDVTHENVPLCGESPVLKSQDRVRVWYKKGIMTDDAFNALHALYQARCLGAFTAKSPDEIDMYFFYVTFPERNLDE